MKPTLLTALVVAVVVASPLAASADHTKYHKRPFAWNGSYDKTYVTREPVHGYSGPALNSFPPDSFSHCDYHRVPIRACDGEGRCKAIAWKLHQFCY